MANACNPIIAPTKILIDLGRASTALMMASIVVLLAVGAWLKSGRLLGEVKMPKDIAFPPDSYVLYSEPFCSVECSLAACYSGISVIGTK